MNLDTFGFNNSGAGGGNAPVSNGGVAGGNNNNNNNNTPQRRTHPIRPVTIKQLLDCQRVGEGVTVIDGREVTQATVVGRVISAENDPNHVPQALTAKHQSFRITDGTGTLLVRQWMDTEQPDETIISTCYVRATGTVKVWAGAPIITGMVRLVSDCNELNYHFLDSILTHLRLTRGNKHAKDETPSVSNSAGAIGSRNMMPGGDKNLLVTDVIVNVIKQSPNNTMGLTVDEITAGAQRYGFSINDVRAGMRTLSNEGRMFQTHDNRFNV